MRTRKEVTYLLIDVETTTDRSVYDYGFVICNKTEILHSYNALVEEVYTDKARMTNAYYANKLFTEYPKLQSQGLQMMSFKQIQKETHELIKKYRPTYVTAYNLAFDSDALGKTSERLLGERFLTEPMEYFCLWCAACQVICQMKTYQKFCIKNGFVTDKGNFKSDAETVYRFLIKDPLFIEDHTALSDCVKVEAPILWYILKRRIKFDKNQIISSPWKLLMK